jgi:hypothetical protein
MCRLIIINININKMTTQMNIDKWLMYTNEEMESEYHDTILEELGMTKDESHRKLTQSIYRIAVIKFHTNLLVLYESVIAYLSPLLVYFYIFSSHLF